MVYRKHKNGGRIYDSVTPAEADVFWQKNKDVGAGVSAGMMKAGGGSTRRRRADRQAAPQRPPAGPS